MSVRRREPVQYLESEGFIFFEKVQAIHIYEGH